MFVYEYEYKYIHMENVYKYMFYAGSMVNSDTGIK